MRIRRWSAVVAAAAFSLASFSATYAADGGSGTGSLAAGTPTPGTPATPPVPMPTPTLTPTPKPQPEPKPGLKPTAKPTPSAEPPPDVEHKPDTEHQKHPKKPGKKHTKRPKDTAAPPPPPPPPPVPQAHTPANGPDFGVWGVDVSKWQHPEDAPLSWPALAGSSRGFGFVFVKASEGVGSHAEPHAWFDRDVAGAEATGAYVGAYHYAGPGLPVTKDALSEARFAVKSAGRPGVGDLPLVLDFEANPDGLTRQQMAAWARTWLAEVDRLTGRKPIVYTSPSFFASDVAPDPQLAQYPLWIAHYGLAVTAPAVPEPWTTWTFWQHSAEGELPGTHGFVDLNVYAGSRAELALLAGVTYQGQGVDAAGVSLLGDAMLSALNDGTGS